APASVEHRVVEVCSRRRLAGTVRGLRDGAGPEVEDVELPAGGEEEGVVGPRHARRRGSREWHDLVDGILETEQMHRPPDGVDARHDPGARKPDRTLPGRGAQGEDLARGGCGAWIDGADRRRHGGPIDDVGGVGPAHRTIRPSSAMNGGRRGSSLAPSTATTGPADGATGTG